MLRYINIICYLCLLSGAVPSTGLAGGIPDLPLGELSEQAGRGFEDKFAFVTHEIGKTSRDNIDAIKKRLQERRGFEKDLAAAKPLVAAFKKGMVISHTLLAQNAINDLETGAVYSIDELVRNKVIDAGVKNKSASRAITDGLIGEQDVVFLALRDQKPPAFSEFGAVSFLFKNDVIDLGYFSPFAYSMGLEVFTDPRLGEDYLATNRRNAAIYRKFVFSGKSALDDFLLLSFVQNENYERLFAKKIRRKIKPFFNDPAYTSAHLPECKRIAEELYELLGQRVSVPGAFSAMDCLHVTAFAYGHVNYTFNLEKPNGERELTTSFPELYGAYRGFPNDELADSLVTRTMPSDFIELKIPRKLDLALMKGILIAKQFRNGRTGEFEAFAAGPLVNAIKAYAKRAGRSFRVIESEDSFEYRFE